MSEAFDPYYEWLGIQPKDQPANHYRLLGIEVFEQNPNVIERSADRQMGHVRTFQNGKRSAESQRLLNELSAAKVCLLNEERKAAYDEELRGQLEQDLAPSAAPGLPIPIAQPVAAAPPSAAVDIQTEEKQETPAVSTLRKKKTRQPKTAARKLAFVGTFGIVIAGGLIAAVFSGAFSGQDSAPPAPNEPKRRVESKQPTKVTPSNPNTEVAEAGSPGTESPGTGEEIAGQSTGGTTEVTGSPGKIDESHGTITDPATASLAAAIRSGIPSEYSRKVYAGEGLQMQGFLLCQSMPYDDLLAIIRPMAAYGCRPLRIRPYPVGDEIKVAAVWTRDARPWRVVAGLTADEFTQAYERLTEAGFETLDVAGFNADQVRFAGVFAKSEQGVPDSEIWLSVTSAEFQERLKSGSTSSLIAHARHFFNARGKHRYNVVWRPAPAGADKAQRFGGSKEFFDSRVKSDHSVLDIAIAGNAEFGHIVGAAVVEGLPPTKQVHSLSPQEHLARCRAFAQQGFAPVSIAVASLKDGDIIAASVWAPVAGSTSSDTPPGAARANNNYALRFDGRDSVTLANTSGLLALSESFTAEVWFRITKPPKTRLSACIGTGATKTLHPDVVDPAMAGWLVAAGQLSNTTSSDTVAIRWSDAQKQVVGISNTVPDLNNDWHHLAICNAIQSDGGWQSYVFVDGVSRMRVRRPATEIHRSPSDFFLGVTEFLTQQTTFFGEIRACRLSKSVRYANNFTPAHTFEADDSTFALLDFDGVNPEEVKDISGGNHHGTINGAKWVEATTTTPQPTPGSPPMVAEAPAERLPVPSPEERQEAAARVKDIFREEYKAAEEAAAKVSLAKDLADQAVETKDAAAKFGLLYEARQLAIEAVDSRLALRLTERLTSQFEVSPWTLKADTMSKLTESAKPVDRRAIADLVMEMAEQAMFDNEFEAAENQIELIVRLNRPRDRELAKAAIALGKEIADGKKLWQSAEQAKQKLADAPDDADANYNLGRYLCFVEEKWDAGLPHLAKASAVALREIAAKDLQQPSDGKGRLAVADAWYDWGSKVSARDRNGAWLRAQYWYTAALPGLADLDRTKAKRRIDEISEQVESQANRTSAFAWLDVNVGEIKRLNGHTAEVRSLSVARNGKYIVSGSTDGTVRFWDLAEGDETALLRPGVGNFSRLGISPDDKFVIVAGQRDLLEIWNIDTGKLASRVDTESSPNDMVVARDTNLLVWAQRSRRAGNVVLFALRQGAVGQLNCPGYPRSVAITDSGKVVAAGSDDGNVYVWSLRPRKIAGPFTGLGDDPTHVALSPDGRLVGACVSNQAMVWDIATGDIVSRMPASQGCYRLDFSPNGRRLLTAGMSNEVTLWNVEDGSKVQTLSSRQGRSFGTATALKFLPDPRGAVSAGSDGTIRVWRLPD